jgi:hypothetical protein
VLGIAITWAAAFAAIGAIFGIGLVLAIASGALPPMPDGPDDLYLMIVASRILRWATIGLLSGIAFAATVAIAGRRETVATLSAPRFARWGMLAGTLGSAAMAAVVAAFILLDGTMVASPWTLLLGFASVPVFGGLLGRATAATMLRAARGEHHALAAAAETSTDAETGLLPRRPG